MHRYAGRGETKKETSNQDLYECVLFLGTRWVGGRAKENVWQVQVLNKRSHLSAKMPSGIGLTACILVKTRGGNW